VSIRASLDRQGAVIEATSIDPGPSRYFERIALETAKGWTFTPADSAAPRSVVVRFNFARKGASAYAD
jgi:TonB family protein